MRRFSLAGLLVAATTAGACSLINAPADVIPGSGGAGGAGTSVSSSDSATSTGTGGGCTVSSDCAGLTDECGAGVCSNGKCTKLADASKDGLACDDGLFCTVTDVCAAGACVGATKPCPDMTGSSSSSSGSSSSSSGSNSGSSGSSGTGGGGTGGSGGAGGGGPKVDTCHVWACVEAAKQCEIVLGPVGSTCDDGEPCTSGEKCVADGSCGNGAPTDCSALDGECATGECKPGVGCSPKPLNEGSFCNALNPCANSVCTAGKCNIVMPTNTNMPCDDGLYCTKTDICLPSGVCGGPPTCSNPTACIVSNCDEAANKCVLDPKANGEPCATTACSAGQTCDNGICGGGTAAATYFYENFVNNNKGWLLGPEWQIGAAMVSPPGAFGADPGDDNTPNTADNGVAGVLIGGNETPVIHPMYYIESPIIDISAAQGQLFLTYFRWLNSDYLPFMKNVVEVFDGTTWIEVWASGASPGIQDSPPAGLGWTFMSHDITPYKNASIKVRFGYDIQAEGAYTIGSWNLDDVKLQNTVCTAVP